MNLQDFSPVLVSSQFVTWLVRFSQSLQLRKVRGTWWFARLLSRTLRDRFVKLPYLDGSVWADLSDYIGHQVFKGSTFEPGTTAVLQDFVRRGYSFLDIGANIGLHTLAAAAQRNSATQVFRAFEPHPLNYQVLQLNCAENNFGFVQCRQIALSDTEGVGQLLQPRTKNSGGHTILQPLQISPDDVLIPCTLCTLDSLAGEDPGFPDNDVLIKIDVEGAEQQVLSGGRTWLSRLDRAAVVFEVSFSEATNHTARELLATLTNLGFVRHFVIDEHPASRNRLTAFDPALSQDLRAELMRTVGKTTPIGNVNLLSTR